MILNSKKSFTLIETLVAIFLLTSGILGVSFLISRITGTATFATQKLIAVYLAQEGIELVRNLRDKNLIEGENFDKGISEGTFRIDYNDLTLNSDSAEQPLNIESSSGFYGYDHGAQTPFSRKITISKPPSSSNVLEVKVEVFWKFKGKQQKVEAQANLYNWR